MQIFIKKSFQTLEFTHFFWESNRVWSVVEEISSENTYFTKSLPPHFYSNLVKGSSKRSLRNLWAVFPGQEIEQTDA